MCVYMYIYIYIHQYLLALCKHHFDLQHKLLESRDLYYI